MIHPKLALEALVQLKEKVKSEAPLIHYLTHAIVMNDCANVILGLGAKPIMAEHPLEAEEITSLSKALGVNLGNISDSRMMAIEHSAKVANERQIPWCIDLVGVGCSSLRKDFAKTLIQNYKPHVIKGNMSEIKAISGIESHACGIDVGALDEVNEARLLECAKWLKDLSKRVGAVIVVTGAIDLISTQESTYAIYNGCPLLAKLTGTGCMLTGMIATYLAEGNALESSLLATLMMGITGELSSKAKGNGSFKVSLLDELYSMEAKTLLEKMRFKLVEGER